VPVHYNEYPTGRPHVPGKDKDRFRSRYLDIPNSPLYPFGYGLTYTSFSVSPVCLDREHMTKNAVLTASVTVRNTGQAKGTETIQLYLHDITASVVRPVKELRGFRKVTLQPGGEETVSFFITEKDLRFWTERGRWESEPGAFEVFVGTSSLADAPARFTFG
ncbi:MAG: fibronectin type III-like domain-contianing protein, partial [Lachnospiraceae bacterium]|nr:fibronectin type III-like domain-contianing protein [Lachnospiraceae bacterium]